jgi:hypothetical protein
LSGIDLFYTCTTNEFTVVGHSFKYILLKIQDVKKYPAEVWTNKTKPTPLTTDNFLAKVADEKVRDDCYELIRIMKKITGEDSKMWGSSIVGFGKYHYKYASGHEGYSWPDGIFAPKTKHHTLYNARIRAFHGSASTVGKA